MLEHLTTKTQHALQQAQQHALLNDCPTLDPLHILVALLEDTDNGCQPLLSFAGGDSNAILNEARQQLQKLPKTSDNGEVSIGRDSARILNLAFKQAQKSGDTHVAADLLLTTLAREHKVCKQLFEKHGVEMAQLKQALEKNRRGQPAQGANAEGGYRALEKYTVNISEQARQGKLDPVIGRNEEIRRTIHILQRRSKNNPVLIGAPGVG
ncbi:MAG: type VI secretion system ATPase TssH, partial [Proteobacteria bacterium]|nr:type VI secretion system ATPase TssH [Pseudomonadota bacterium]